MSDCLTSVMSKALMAISHTARMHRRRASGLVGNYMKPHASSKCPPDCPLHSRVVESEHI